MDSFEHVVAAILERQGFWTRTSVKVDLTREEKRAIGRPSSPRWELDVVGYNGRSNQLLIVECKSYLDSRGVAVEAFEEAMAEQPSRYKLFVDETLRRVVIERLTTQLVEKGFCAPDPSYRLCLAAGRIYGDAAELHALFDSRGWLLWGPDWLRSELRGLADSGYENSVASVVAKLLLREGTDVRKAEVRDERASRGSYEHIPDGVRRDALVAAYYLSKFQHDRLGLGNQDQTFDAVAQRLGIKKHTLKNYRDRFDPYTDSGRRGWWQAELTPELAALASELREVSEEALRSVVLRSIAERSSTDEASR